MRPSADFPTGNQQGDIPQETYTKEETVDAAAKFFGGTSSGLAKAIEKAFSELGKPVGYIIGRAYAGFRRGYTFGLLMYAVFVLFLIESLRYSYLAETRFVPLAVGLILLAFDIRRLRLQTG